MKEGRQQMGQQMGQMGQMGQGTGSLGDQLMAQIAELKQQLGYGGYMQGGQGQASSGWGLGTSPYAVEPAPADAEHQVENRQGDDSLENTQPIDFEPLYAPEDYAHGFSSEDQLHGAFDPTAPPEQVEEIRSAPETQEALQEYADIIGTYTEGEESAIDRERVTLEYQELVRRYFERVAALSNQEAPAEDEAAEGDGGDAEGGASDEGESSDGDEEADAG